MWLTLCCPEAAFVTLSLTKWSEKECQTYTCCSTYPHWCKLKMFLHSTFEGSLKNSVYLQKNLLLKGSLWYQIWPLYHNAPKNNLWFIVSTFIFLCWSLDTFCVIASPFLLLQTILRYFILNVFFHFLFEVNHFVMVVLRGAIQLKLLGPEHWPVRGPFRTTRILIILRVRALTSARPYWYR